MKCLWLGLVLGVFGLVVAPGVIRAESPQRPGPRFREMLREFDKNNDGQLDQSEKAALRKHLEEHGIEVPPGIQAWLAGQGPLPDALRPSAPPAPEGVIIERDVVYGHAGDRPLKLDILRPRDMAEKCLPLVVFVHGGGWRAGDKSAGVGRLMRLVQSGRYVGASVGYRLSGEAPFPAQIHDCKAAIRFLKAHAEKYHLDPQRIGVWGTSAGGHLVSLLGTSGDVKELEGDCGWPEQSSRVHCVVDFCGPSDFLAFADVQRGDAASAIAQLLGGSVREKRDLAKAASPVTYVTPDDPPFLIVHGTEDAVVPFSQAETLHAALQKAGVPSTLVRIEGGGHGFGGPQVDARVEAFLAKHLRGQDVEVSAEPIRPGPRP